VKMKKKKTYILYIKKKKENESPQHKQMKDIL